MTGQAATEPSPEKPRRYVGVDGGGTGTRVMVSDGNDILSIASGGPAALSRGVENAWQVIEMTCATAFSKIGESVVWEKTAVGIGVAGAHHDGWRNEFIRQAPATERLVVETDSRTSLLGAHAGKPGVCIALGTGSVGEVLREDGSTHVVGGFGFPAGDEGSGAWFGLQAAGYTQRAIDGRENVDVLTRELFARATGSDEPIEDVRARLQFMRWHSCARATDFAALVPTLFEHPTHPFVRDLIKLAIVDVSIMIHALDPGASLNVALCGSVGKLLEPHFHPAVAKRLIRPQGTAVAGALMLIAKDNRPLEGKAAA